MNKLKAIQKLLSKRRIFKLIIILCILAIICWFINFMYQNLFQNSTKQNIIQFTSHKKFHRHNSASFNKRRLIKVEKTRQDGVEGDDLLTNTEGVDSISKQHRDELYPGTGEEHTKVYNSSFEVEEPDIKELKDLLTKENKNEQRYREEIFKKMENEKREFNISSLHSKSSNDDEINIKPMKTAVLKDDFDSITFNYTKCLVDQFQQHREKFVGYSFPEMELKIRKSCFLFIFGDENGNICKYPNNEVVGPLLVDFEVKKSSELEIQLDFVKKGGWWKPVDCLPRNKVAIIIPFRDRESHLLVLLFQLHSMLRRQKLMYRILVIEQHDEYPFNRGKLMNVGYSEAIKMFPFTCFVFHDVDLIPENDLNDYGCPTSPRHLSCAVDKFDYKLPYPGIFGGVEMFKNEHFEKINGFSNGYWGWGAEDDDLYKRITEYGFELTRPSTQEGRYKMIKHDSSDGAPPNRMDRLNNAQEEIQTDGLSSLQYKVIDVIYEQFYTKIKVDLNLEGDMLY